MQSWSSNRDETKPARTVDIYTTVRKTTERATGKKLSFLLLFLIFSFPCSLYASALLHEG